MKISVLNLGYVRLVDSMGTDLSVVNAARVSFAKESKEFSNKDAGLLHYLVRNRHLSPFRHAMITLEVKAPLMVARQWWKHVVGCDHTMDGWNEVSRRYVQDEPEFYFPEQWRLAPSDMKQGSAGFIEGSVNSMLNSELNDRIIQGWQSYKYAIGKGVAPEMARGFLPSNFQYTTWRWTTSLEAAIHFLSLRLDSHAQYEIQCYASAVRELLRDKFPESLSAFETGSEEKALEL